jgi:hypothetical protein
MPSMARVGEIATAIGSPDDARELLGQSLVLLNAAYGVTSSYKVGPIGSDVASANTAYLDGIRLRAEADYRALPASGETLDRDKANQIAFDIASIEAAANQSIDLLGKSTALGELGDSIVEAGAGIVKSAADAVGGVIPWWVWIVAAAVVVLIVKQKAQV